LQLSTDIVLWLAGLPKRLSKYAQDSREGGRFAFLSIPAKSSIAWLRSDKVICTFARPLFSFVFEHGAQTDNRLISPGATQMSVAISVASILVFSSAIRKWFPYVGSMLLIN
jgi:hypothetical protein